LTLFFSTTCAVLLLIYFISTEPSRPTFTWILPSNQKAAALSQDGHRLIVATIVKVDPGTIHNQFQWGCGYPFTVRDAASGQVLFQLEDPRQGNPKRMAAVRFTPDEHFLAFQDEEGPSLFNLSDHIWHHFPICFPSLSTADQWTSNWQFWREVYWVPDHKTFVVREDDGIHLWDTTSKKDRAVLPVTGEKPKTERSIGKGSPGSIHLLASPDNTVLATWPHGKELQIWKLEDGNPVSTISISDHRFSSLYFLDNHRIITIVNSAAPSKKLVQIWDVQSGKFLNNIDIPTMKITREGSEMTAPQSFMLLNHGKVITAIESGAREYGYIGWELHDEQPQRLSPEELKKQQETQFALPSMRRWCVQSKLRGDERFVLLKNIDSGEIRFEVPVNQNYRTINIMDGDWCGIYESTQATEPLFDQILRKIPFLKKGPYFPKAQSSLRVWDMIHGLSIAHLQLPGLYVFNGNNNILVATNSPRVISQEDSFISVYDLPLHWPWHWLWLLVLLLLIGYAITYRHQFRKPAK
jgi:WD40 repeat protein